MAIDDRHRVYMSFQDRHGWQCQFLEADLQTPLRRANLRQRPREAGNGAGHDVSHSGSLHAPEMKPEQKQEQADTPQREITPHQEQGEDFGLGL